ncbi:MAG: aminotransferase class I/II-fold pyridoxal phosphate-dependent enzyme [Candidatus Eremiobacteraeota bacterium]|nr:aminotransferase class I/II-fold pyridoxal phosphate-dependent enzyme [Candidatus Eremiobacteraeota bacterium]
MPDHETLSQRMQERGQRIRARALDDTRHPYSEKTHLIHGRFDSARWDYQHHVVPPMSSSVTYRLDTSVRGAEGFTMFGLGHKEDQAPIYIYDRLDEPTRGMLEQNLAYAESGEMAVCFASGMAAITAALGVSAKAGERVLAHHVLYGCTFSLLKNWLPRFGIAANGINLNDLELLEAELTAETRVVYFETPVNPDLELIDIEAVVKVVDGVNQQRPPDERIRVIVDNTFATPYCQRPLELGADLVVASLTKNIGGFGTDLGGVVVGKKELEPALLGFRKDFGAVLSPKSAWPVLVYGLPTLPVRVRQQQQTAERVARFLEEHSCVKAVRYPGLESFPQYELAQRQMVDYEGLFAPGTLVYFALDDPDGSRAGRFIDYVAENAYSITMAVSLGQIKTLIEHPFSMTHAAMTCQEQASHLVDPGGIRLSMGLEKGEDLIYDLEEAFRATGLSG